MNKRRLKKKRAKMLRKMISTFVMMNLLDASIMASFFFTIGLLVGVIIG